MRRLVLLLFLSFYRVLLAIEVENPPISIGVIVDANSSAIPAESSSFLTNRIKKALTADGFADSQSLGRFAVVVECDVLEKDVTPTTPVRISQKLELSFLIVDLVENKIYESMSMTVSGIGTNDTKAFNSAFQKVSLGNESFRTMLSTGKEKIMDYYTNHCPEIITTARTLASMAQYDKAIFSLMSVPNVCSSCFEQCQTLATEIYIRKIDHECATLLTQAKSKWAGNASETSAAQVADIIGRIDPRSGNYGEVIAFRDAVSAKLSADAKREWEFQMKKYEDNQQFKRSIVEACRSVGETFAKNFQLPQISVFKRH